MKLFKRGEIIWMDFTVAGKRHRETSGTSDKLIAKAMMMRRMGDLMARQRPGADSQVKDMRLEDAVDLTLAEYFEKMASYDVVKATLQKTTRILGADIGVAGITEETYKTLRDALKKENRTNCTINKYFSGLNRVLKHVATEHGITCPKGVRDTFLKVDNGRIRTISYREEEEIRDWFGKATKLRESWENQDLTDILDVLFATGMRRGECFSFTVSQCRADHIEFQADQHKTGKKAGAKAVCLNATAQKVIQERIERHELQLGDRVFGYSKDAFTRLWATMRKDFGLEQDAEFVPHAIRHTFASRLAAKGASIYDVSKLMGHSSIKTTEKYAHMFVDRLVETAKLLD